MHETPGFKTVSTDVVLVSLNASNPIIFTPIPTKNILIFVYRRLNHLITPMDLSYDLILKNKNKELENYSMDKISNYLKL